MNKCRNSLVKTHPKNDDGSSIIYQQFGIIYQQLSIIYQQLRPIKRIYLDIKDEMFQYSLELFNKRIIKYLSANIIFRTMRKGKGHRRGGDDEKVSKAMSKVLRHAAVEEGLQIDSSGYVEL